MVLVGRPIEGAQPTSLTQSLWASSFWSSFHWPSSSLKTKSKFEYFSSSMHTLDYKAFWITSDYSVSESVGAILLLFVFIFTVTSLIYFCSVKHLFGVFELCFYFERHKKKRWQVIVCYLKAVGDIVRFFLKWQSFSKTIQGCLLLLLPVQFLSGHLNPCLLRLSPVWLSWRSTRCWNSTRHVLLHSLPEFDEVVTASRDKAFDVVWFLSRRLVDQTARDHSRSPTHCITTDL